MLLTVAILVPLGSTNECGRQLIKRATVFDCLSALQMVRATAYFVNWVQGKASTRTSLLAY